MSLFNRPQDQVPEQFDFEEHDLSERLARTLRKQSSTSSDTPPRGATNHEGEAKAMTTTETKKEETRMVTLLTYAMDHGYSMPQIRQLKSMAYQNGWLKSHKFILPNRANRLFAELGEEPQDGFVQPAEGIPEKQTLIWWEEWFVQQGAPWPNGWRDIRTVAGVRKNASRTEVVEASDIVEGIMTILNPIPAQQSPGEGDAAEKKPTGEPEAAQPEPDLQSPPDTEPDPAQAAAEPEEGDHDQASPEGETTEPPEEEQDMEDQEIRQLRSLIGCMKAGYSDYNGLRQMSQADRDRHFATHPGTKDRYDQYQYWVRETGDIFRLEAQRQDPKGDRLPWGDRTKWNKWVWRKLQLLLHPDSNNSLNREDLEGLFSDNGRAKASAGSQQRASSSSGSSGQARPRSQQSQRSRQSTGPASFEEMVAKARRYIESAPIESWTYTRTDANNRYINAGFIRLVARYGLGPFKEDFASDLKDLSAAERNELASKVFRAAFEQILTDTFG